MKYIKNKQGDVVIFTGGMSHDDVARKLGWKHDDISGAGFVHGLGGRDAEAMETEIVTVGQSVTLGIKANPDDARRIIREIRGY